jgi:glycosyltransferase involved in cell wall biosynthesis
LLVTYSGSRAEAGRGAPLLAVASASRESADTLPVELPVATPGQGEAPRICIVGPLPPPEGGMANQTRQLADLLRTEGLTVEVVRTNAPYSPPWVAQTRGVRAIARLSRYVGALWSAFGRCDVVHLMTNSGWAWHLFAAPALWVAWLRGKAVVVNYRGGEAERFLAGSSRLVRISLSRARIVAVPSRFLRRVFAAHGVAAEVVPNIVDLRLFAPRTIPGELSAPAHVVVARNLEAIYDNETAIRAFALVRRAFPTSRMSIAGTGPELGRLSEIAHECGVAEAVTFVGRLDREAMAALYRSADVSVNPSRVDNMPNSVLEALACGVPVVSTHVGGVPYMVDHGRTALLVPPQDPQAMADCIVRLLTDRELARRIASAGIADVQQFGWPAVKGRWIDIYARLMPLRRRGKAGS